MLVILHEIKRFFKGKQSLQTKNIKREIAMKVSNRYLEIFYQKKNHESVCFALPRINSVCGFRPRLTSQRNQAKQGETASQVILNLFFNL